MMPSLGSRSVLVNMCLGLLLASPFSLSTDESDHIYKVSWSKNSELPTDCRLFTYGGCTPDISETIDVYPIPDVVDAEDICQEVCLIQEGCNFFSYDRSQNTCSLYRYRYSDSCQTIGGPVRPSVKDCEPGPMSGCDSFVWENCNYISQVVFNKTSVTDSNSCQNLLTLLGDVYGAEYFVYDMHKHVCSFYSQIKMFCTILNGPKEPSYSWCGNSSTLSFQTADSA